MSVEDSLNYLASAECFDSLRRDPYWPKWHSPWWHMTLLWEMGLADRIPQAACRAMLESMDRRWSRVWLPSEGLPEDWNPQTDAGCFCAIGTMEQVLRAAGVDEGSFWAWNWPLQYVLPDGGVNCYSEVYEEGGSRRSSFQSTIAVAEAVLSRPALNAKETAFLDGAANYLITRRLFRTSKGEVVDLGWLQPKFPRFYDYDVARGLKFLEGWSKRLGRTIPEAAVREAVRELKKGFEPADCLSHPDLGGRPATTFPLLERAIRRRP